MKCIWFSEKNLQKYQKNIVQSVNGQYSLGTGYADNSRKKHELT